MKVPMARWWNSVIGPRADDGERRHDWDRCPNARAHSEDSSRRAAACWLIGLTTWDDTVEGSIGTYCRIVRSWARRLSETSRSSAGRSSPSAASRGASSYSGVATFSKSSRSSGPSSVTAHLGIRAPSHRRTYPAYAVTESCGRAEMCDGRAAPGSDPQACLETVELGPEHGGQLLAELLEPLLDLRDLGLPLLGVDREGLADLLL